MLKIKYSTDGNDLNVTIRIFDFSFNYVRTVIQHAPRNRDINGPPDFWDGKDDNGNYVPNGVYFYRVEVGDNDGIYGKILVLQ
jgi:flagellar hook assembly protein FlgD